MDSTNIRFRNKVFFINTISIYLNLMFRLQIEKQVIVQKMDTEYLRKRE